MPRSRAVSRLATAFATRERLDIGQKTVAEGSHCFWNGWPAKSLDGAPGSTDVIACNLRIAKAVGDAGADYLIAVNASQPGLFAEIQSLLDDLGGPPERGTETSTNATAESRSAASLNPRISIG